ncbi:hypothetical protein M2651_09110 [Clostridium sp. SYSU_GA19001]|uniref:hypothetical protein n=1 Tax=Clostridium caldaquaticum TaxID=2940653 RepID=UPI0020771149|nr:hypothetical protein [Clostridium caldaquaticum]MCM8711186.1 hypothetical protein [Clostridium caldaquaticum]
MNIGDIKDKLKGIIASNNSNEIDLPLKDEIKHEEIQVSDEVEEIMGERPFRIKTVIVKDEEQGEEKVSKKRIDKVKIIAGAAIAAAGLAAIILSSRKRK